MLKTNPIKYLQSQNITTVELFKDIYNDLMADRLYQIELQKLCKQSILIKEIYKSKNKKLIRRHKKD